MRTNFKKPLEELVGREGNSGGQHFSFSHKACYTIRKLSLFQLNLYQLPILKFNPLPDMSILGYSYSVAKKDMMAKI